MDIEKRAFIQMILEANVLSWGEFTLKSGRVSPYFFNAGLFYKGSILRQVGASYANTLIKNKPGVNHLFGPAYKGLPLATATAIACAEQNTDVEVTFNRKEIKTHGEGGQIMGAPLKGKKVVMIDDVITAGTAFRESKALITAAGGTLTTVVIALDRQERGPSGHSTLAEIKAEGIQVLSIITLNDLMDYLESNAETKQLERLKNYRERYGA
ncbi:MAG: orotate phosphoribosyltransferase [Gammaproteobacteria bacterium]|nr:orotate phosphoribosyltransferase [Gammaproteobacteria bacterium]